MRALMIAVVLIAAAGCKSQTPPGPLDLKACEAKVGPAIERIMADYKADPRVAAVIDKAKSEMTTACAQDRWSAAVGKCIEDAKDRAAMDQCRVGLTKDQMDHVKSVTARLRGAIEQLQQPAPEAPAPEVPLPGAGSGSASGSAGCAVSGSAGSGCAK